MNAIVMMFFIGFKWGVGLTLGAFGFAVGAFLMLVIIAGAYKLWNCVTGNENNGG